MTPEPWAALLAAFVVLALLMPPGLLIVRSARAPELGLAGAFLLGLCVTSAIAYVLGLAGASFGAARAVLLLLSPVSLLLARPGPPIHRGRYGGTAPLGRPFSGCPPGGEKARMRARTAGGGPHPAFGHPLPAPPASGYPAPGEGPPPQPRRWIPTPVSGPPWAWRGGTAFDAGLAALGAAVAALAAWQGPWLSHTADSFYHLAAIRSILIKDEAFATLPIYPGPGPGPDPTSSGWHTVLAAAASVTWLDAVVLWRAAQPLAAAASIVALGRFGWLVSGRRSVGLGAAALALAAYGGLDLRAAAYPNQIGLGAMLAWLSLLLLLARRRSARRTGAAAACGLGLAAVHVGVALAGAALAAVLVLALAVGRRRDAAARVALAAVVALLAVAARSAPLGPAASPFDDRVGVPPYPPGAPSAIGPLTAPILEWLALSPSLPPAPTVLASAVVAAALAAFVAGRARAGRWSPPPPDAAVAFAGAGAALAVALASALPLPAIAAYGLIRIAVPLGILQPVLLAWTGARLADEAAARRPGPRPVPAPSHPPTSPRPAGLGVVWRPTRPWVGARGVAPLAGLALLAWSVGASLTGWLGTALAPADPSGHSLASSRAADLSIGWAERLAALRELPPGTVIAAPPEAAYYLAGLADLFVTATPLSHTPAGVARRGGWLRRGDAEDLFGLSAEPYRLAGLVERSEASYFLVDDTAPAWMAWRDQPPPIFSVVRAGEGWRLLRRDRTGLAGYLDGARGWTGGADGWAFAPALPVAGEVLFARRGGSSDGLLRLVGAAGEALVAVPIAEEVTPLPLPIDAPVGRYRLTLRRPSGEESVLAEVPVGREYEAESFPIELAPPSGAARGWTLYEQSIYRRHLAARTNGPAIARRPIAPLPPGRYTVFARVFEDPYPRPNALEARFGGASVGLLWGGESNTPRWISNPVETRSVATELEIAATRIEQNWLIVDAVRIYPGR